MAEYTTLVRELTDADPAFQVPDPSPRSVTVFARAGTASVSTGGSAAGEGLADFTVQAGEVWQWFVDERVDWVEQATVTANAGADVVVMWQRIGS